MLNIKKSVDGEAIVFALEGRLDTVTAPDLEKEIRESADSAQEMVMDFADLEYISSAGLRVLLSAHKAMSKKGGMKVIHVNEMIMEIFEVTGFSDILVIA